MKILFFGDIIGENGIDGLFRFLKKYNEKEKADFIFANGENISSGRGIDKKSYYKAKKIDIDGFTLGNHAFDKKEVFELMKEKTSIIRPLNLPIGSPGKGYCVFYKNNYKIAVINLCGRIFINSLLDCPFKKIESSLNIIKEKTNNIIVDIHAESTSEKKALGFFLDGKVTAVLGTHTHTQTNDLQLLKKGTIFLTDLGMIGSKDSILGCKKDNIINHFLTGSNFKIEIEKEGLIQINGIEIILNKNDSISSYKLINELI